MAGGDSELMLVGMLVCALGFPLLLLVGGWLVLRGLRANRDDETASAPWRRLNERLAAGEIDVEDYSERESALRSSGLAPPQT
jgi:uncharacterized membrane protein